MEEIPRHRFRDLNGYPITLKMGGYTSEMLYWGYIEPLYWRNYRHVHSFFEVCYAYSGCGQFRIFNETIDVHEGQLFFARPNDPHDIVSSHEDPLGICFWAYTLIPISMPESTSSSNVAVSSGAAFENTSHGRVERDPLNILFATFAETGSRIAEANDTLTQTIDLLTKEIIAKQAGYSSTIPGLVSNLLVETARLGCPQSSSSQLDVPTLEPETAKQTEIAVVLQIKHYLQDNYMRPVRLKEIAAQVHLSERHVCRLFAKETGLSIQQHLVNIRIGVAKQMLLDQANPIAEVATATGFSDQRYFSTFFRRYTGETPTNFRRSGGTAFLDCD